MIVDLKFSFFLTIGIWFIDELMCMLLDSMGGSVYGTNISILANLKLLNNHKSMILVPAATIVEVKVRVNCRFG